jgi:small subunit ribosomal protein S17
MGRSIIGSVVSDKADKTIVLAVTERKTHPLYKKQYSRTTKYIAHDEKNEAKVGDKVEVVETKPISRRKHLTLAKIIQKADIAADLSVDAITAKDAGSEASIAEKKEAEAAAKKAEKEAAEKKAEAAIAKEDK